MIVRVTPPHHPRLDAAKRDAYFVRAGSNATQPPIPSHTQVARWTITHLRGATT